MQENLMKGNFAFFAINLLICVLAAGMEGFQQLNKVIDSSIWKVEQLTVNQLIFSCFCCCCYVWWLIHPYLYFGTLVFPSILLLAITMLTSFTGLSHVLLYTLILHHLPDIVLSMLRLSAAYKIPNSHGSNHSGQILASLAALSSVPIWLLTRFYWFVQLLNPLHLETLPDSCVASGLIVHVLMWILVVFNALHFWRMLRHFWEYVTGTVVHLVEPFTPPKTAVPKRCRTAADSSDGARCATTHSRQQARALYQTIKCVIRLKRKIRRRREARQMTACGLTPSSTDTGVRITKHTHDIQPSSHDIQPSLHVIQHDIQPSLHDVQHDLQTSLQDVPPALSTGLTHRTKCQHLRTE